MKSFAFLDPELSAEDVVLGKVAVVVRVLDGISEVSPAGSLLPEL